MALPRYYTQQACGLARALEVVGERWTLLIVRDAFYGLRRFGEFTAHLEIPRAVLTERLNRLVEADVLARVPAAAGRSEYELTAKGRTLWPVVRSLMSWGDEHYAVAGPRRLFRHAADDGPLDERGICAVCGREIAIGDTVVVPGPGLGPPSDDDDAVSAALRDPHRMLEPLRD